MANQIVLRRGAEAAIPLLEIGEPAFTTDTKKLYIGSPTGNIFIAAAGEALQGPQGPAGAQGPAGVAGAAGPQGPQGLMVLTV